ncbi:MAG: alkaline phosphatase D family protein, partial [Woeseiaceae bacterium]
GPLQKNKLASNQAWFEYCPAALSRAAAGPAGENPARDFVPTSVENNNYDRFDDSFLSLEENNLKSIGSMTIYRSLPWGKTADLLLIDGRSYRGKRGVDDTILGSDSVAYPSAPIDPAIVDTMSAGRTANDGNPPDKISYQGREIDNPRKDAPATTMLGASQKAWLKKTLSNSTARWKVLCNNVPMMRFGFDSTFTEHGVPDGIYFSDSWDGYPNERNELMQFIVEQNIANVISLTGDRHAHFAGLVYDNYALDSPFPVMAEIAGASVSAPCRQQLQQRLSGNDPVFAEIAVANAESTEYIYKSLPALNAWMLYGADAAKHFNTTADVLAARERRHAAVNPHLSYADNDAYGFFRITIDAERCAVEFVTEPQPVVDHTSSDEPPVRRRVKIDVPAVDAGQPARLERLRIIGEEPLMGIKWED